MLAHSFGCALPCSVFRRLSLPTTSVFFSVGSASASPQQLRASRQTGSGFAALFPVPSIPTGRPTPMKSSLCPRPPPSAASRQPPCNGAASATACPVPRRRGSRSSARCRGSRPSPSRRARPDTSTTRASCCRSSPSTATEARSSPRPTPSAGRGADPLRLQCVRRLSPLRERFQKAFNQLRRHR